MTDVEDPRRWQLLALSARGPDGLEAAHGELNRHLEAHPELHLEDVAYTLHTDRKRLSHRRVLLCSLPAGDATGGAGLVPEKLLERVDDTTQRRVAFLLPGLGDHYAEMGRGLYDSEPVFRDAVDRSAKLLEPHLGRDLRQLLYPGEGEARPDGGGGIDLRRMLGRGAPTRRGADAVLDSTLYALPATFVVEYALARLWLSWGIRAEAMIGYSLGEYVAACLAGVMSFEDALTVIVRLAQLLHELPGGAMLAVPLAPGDWLDPELDVAAVNAPDQCVVAGPEAAIEVLATSLAAEGQASRRLPVRHAFHSRHMTPVAKPFAEVMRGIRLQPPEIPFLSNVTGTWITDAEATDPEYWARHEVHAVRFTDGVAELCRDQRRALLEVGPGQTLGTLVRLHPAYDGEQQIIPSLPSSFSRRGDLPFVLDAAGQLWLGGASFDWSGFYAGRRRRRVPLPAVARGLDGAAATPVRPLPASDYVAPRTETERQVARIWKDVLGVEHVGRRDNFFELDGHSLLATQVISRVRDRFGVELPQRALFTHPTLASLAAEIERLCSAGESTAVAPIRPRADREDVPLSYSQERMWFLDQLEPDSTAFTLQIVMRWPGRVRPRELAESLDQLRARHEALRTTFPTVDGVPRQCIAPATPRQLEIVDISGLPVSRSRAEAERIQRRDQARPFDLAAGPLMRAVVFRLASASADHEDHLLLLTLHHIVTDDWSNNVLRRELQALYQARRSGHRSPLPELQVQYADYARWQRRRLRGELSRRELVYWRDKLGDEPSELDLPADRPRPRLSSSQGGSFRLVLSKPLTEALEALGRSSGASLFMTLLAGFKLLVARMTGQTDVCVGSPVAGRDRSEIEGLIGCFLNTVVLRSDLSGDPTFRQLLARVRGVALEAYDHQEIPFEKLLEELQPRRDLSRNPYFQVYCNLLHGTFEELAAVSSADVPAGEIVESAFSVARFDLNLYLLAGPDQLDVVLSYRKDLFDPSTVRRILGWYHTLLQSIVEDPERAISTLPLIGAAERRQLHRRSGRTGPGTDSPVLPASELEGTLTERFAHWVDRAPGQVAVRTPEETWTYAQLERLANRAARGIQRAVGRRGGERIALLFDPGVKAVQGMLGALASGHAYVPLDPAYPAERLRFLIADAEVAAVLTESRHVELARSVAGDGVELVFVEELAELAADPVISPASPDWLAYILYTSGSTGQPKGVMQSHRGVLAHALTYANALCIGPEDCLSLLSSYTFDAAVMDIYGALLSGATLCPISLRQLGAGEILDWMDDAGVTIYHSTPTVFRYLTGGLAPDRKLTGARAVVLGGEEARGGDVRQFQQHFCRGSLLVNGLGPTESTLALQSFMDHETATDRRRVPVGHSVDGTRVELIGPDGAGGQVLGEIALSSPHLALGYWRRAAQTARSFLPAEGGGRLYRTGDLGRLCGDGAVEFMGRLDAQLKIRGHRVEPGEVAAVLESHPVVSSAAVVAVTDGEGEQRLVGYVVAEPAVELRTEELRPFLQQRLPEYMVPEAMVSLDALPVTPNGKLDRPALPAPQWGGETASGYVAPRRDIEKQVAAIWCEVLGVERVGVRDNFFDLGGHSLRVLRVRTELLEKLGRDVPVADLFQHPTVETLAARLVRDAASDRSLRREAAARFGARRREGDDVVAVVAMAGRFPGAPDLETFWQNLRDGVESIRVFTDEELRAGGVQEAELDDPDYVKAGAILEGEDLFDAWFFGYNPREAQLIDPQQRLFLECAWTALERAGCDPERYEGLIGVWAGADLNRYLENLRCHPEILAEAGSFQVRQASDKNHLATRVSYKLNLRGPSVNVQTACSTSLVAVHEACTALREHRCDMALAGGVSVIVPAVSGYRHQPGGILSPDGHCRPFDARAAGTLNASGLGIVVLKRLVDAQRDGDRICALIRGTAINNDGARKVGYTAPSVDGQAEVIAHAHAVAGVDAETITYVEAHGTGTALGDPVEVAALQRVFGEATSRRQFCGLGSLKSNIGHLNATAGIGGLIKTVLALQHRELPPSLHYEQPNPEIDFENSAFYVNAALKPWPGASLAPRRAGVSSFGIGGTNAHAVLEEAPPQPSGEAPARPDQLLVLSAKTPAALAQVGENLAAYLDQRTEVSLADVAWTLQTGRSELEHRRAVVAADVAGACAALRGERRTTSSIGQAVAGHHDVAFLFPGQGAQYVGMGHGLYQRERVFRATVDRCCDLLAGELDADLRSVLYPESGLSPEASDRLRCTSWAQPALFVIELALAEQWRDWGIEPSVMAGHSVGELVAATLSGVFRLEDALSLIALRGRLMERMPSGVMTAVPLSAADVENRLVGEDGLWLSAVNGPSLCVVSGADDRVTAWEAELEMAGVACRRQHTSHAFHSAMMEGAVAPFIEAVRTVEIGEPKVPYVSNVTGRWITSQDLRDPGYWGRHIRQAVRFSEGLDRILAEDRRVLLEVGPGRVLGTLARQQPQWTPRRLAVSSLRRPSEQAPDVEFLLGALGRLWTGGVTVPWRRVYGEERRRRVELPTYPFERQRFWLERRSSSLPRSRSGRKADIGNWFYIPSWRRSQRPEPAPASAKPVRCLTFVADGKLDGEVVDRLAAAGREVITVAVGTAFRRTPTGYVVNPRSAEDLRLLLADGAPDQIVHLWTLSDAADGPDGDVEGSMELGFYSLVRLARALGEAAVTSPVKISVVTDRVCEVVGGEPLMPEKAAVLGPCRTIGLELPNLQCQVIDLPVAGTIYHSIDTIELMMRELLSSATDPMVAYRHGNRWVESFAPAPLPAVASPYPHRLRPGGTYLITGGLGGMGLTLADYLARSLKAKLVLTGRSVLPDRQHWASHLATHADDDSVSQKIRAVEKLEASGAEVMVASADVTAWDQMCELTARARARFGRIHGVIHAAGVAGGSLILRQEPTRAARVLAPKVIGTRVLERLFRDAELDFLVLCSSITAVKGSPGLVAYCAANACLSAFARELTGTSDTFTVAIDWNAWRQVGMAVDAAGGPLDESEGISSSEGVEVFTRVLEWCNEPRIQISEVDLEARLVASRRPPGPAGAVPADTATPSVSSTDTPMHARPYLATEYVAPRTAIELALAEVWQLLLGVESVGIEDDFLDLGGHSLLAIQLLNRLNARYPDARLSLKTVFDHPTVAGLATFIEESGSLVAEPGNEHQAPEDIVSAPLRADDVAAEEFAVVDVDQLSMAEVDKLLADLAEERPGEKPR